MSFHEGYYEDLYGIIIDENHLYDYGVYQSSGFGSLNTLSSAYDWGVTVDFRPRFITKMLKLKKVQLNPAIRLSFVNRSFSFENNSDELLEIDPQTLNSSTILIDDMNFRLFKLGVSAEISRIPTKITICP